MYFFVPENYNVFLFPAQPISQPPDVTNNARSTRQADRVGPYAASHVSSVRMTNTGNVTGMSDDGKSVRDWYSL